MQIFFGALVYDEFMDLHRDDQLLKSMLITEACFPKIVKKIEDGGIPLELLVIS